MLGAGLAVSLAVHGFLLGSFSFWGPEPAGWPVRPEEASVFQVPAIELVRIEEPPEQVVPEPVTADAPIILTAPASEEVSEPKSGEALVAASGEVAASAAAPMGGAAVADNPLSANPALAESGFPSAALSMLPRLGSRQGRPESIREPIEVPGPYPEADHAEGEGEEDESWWRRLGAKFGIGSGSKICVPRPEVMDTVPRVAEK
ncbi:MAG: hypothetical protein OXQ94_09125 [Gemmatimonadota bacterium]|nr:hypothetical protein [Gemmatimonadota bacterium]